MTSAINPYTYENMETFNNNGVTAVALIMGAAMALLSYFGVMDFSEDTFWYAAISTGASALVRLVQGLLRAYLPKQETIELPPAK